ncbi:uncharacterized protein DUF4347 [Nitrosomonas nitrosa]|uniref:DUF4347 domain-containing protein n=1 Tax=Nitrosomonas nitrosa TaxID=52442 RepID=UPI000D306635|nr:DUF4347 domain-containing protein [Nitrosomonas nitrosa]PTR00644.1 uncharacterized protein DUF4347 [Nitrosomonas nitrosa]
MVRKPTTRPALTNAKPDNAMDRTEDMPAAKRHAPLSPANKTPLQPLSRKELVFIDQGVDDYPTLIAGVKEGVDIHLIDPTRDGVLQITAILNQQTDISAVHIVSHGNVGYLALGNSVLSTETLTHYQDALFSWRQALVSDADILIYGCNVAKGASGKQFIQRLALLTGANIAASNNLTGNSKLGGDWVLGVFTSSITSKLVFFEKTLEHYSSTFVSNTLNFSSDVVSDYVTATHPTANFGTINFKIVKDVDSTGTANASLTLALTGQVDQSYNDFYYSGSDGEYLVIYTDGREVDFQSVKFGSLGLTVFTNLTAYAYKDGSLLGSQTFNPSGANFPNDSSSITPETVTFTSAIFDNADEIRLIGANNFGDDVGGSLIDDLVIADPIPPNASPSISVNDSPLSYTENTAAIQTDTSATLADTDGDTDWNGGTLTVQITANSQAADQLSIIDNVVGTINTNNTSLLNGATVIGTLSASEGTVSDSTALTITFNASATNTLVQQVIRAIHYDNTSDDPGTANRTITFTATDTHGATASDTRTVTVTAVNDAPTLTATGSSPTFNQGGTAADLFSGISASTVESNQTLEQLIITVTNVTDGAGANEFLIIDGEDVALSNGNAGSTATLGIGYSVALVVDTATVTLTKAGMSTADVQTLIDGLAYSNTSSSPSSANRVVTITSMQDNGGTTNGGVDTATLSISSTVTVVPKPVITSATYDAALGKLVVTGTNIQANNSGADIDVSKLTFTGEGGATYTLTDSADVERDSATQFNVTLSATDKAAVNLILNKNGTASTDISTYNLAAADDWNTHVTDGDTADNTGNGITVSNVAVPTITAASYDANSGALTVTGTGFLSRSGATNDIIAAKFSFTGEGGTTYTLTDTADVEITSGTAFTIMLSATDKAAVNQITNKNGTASTSGTTYNLAAAEDWAVGADAAVTVADTTGNSVTVSNVAVPTITAASYDANSGALTVTGTGFLSRSGATNDIVASKFTFTGEGGETYTLTDSANVEITSGTAFTITLSATDKAAVNQITNKNGTASTSGTTYNLAAAEDWAVGADAAVTVADTTGNSVTVSNVAVPTITSATYDANSGALTVTGTDFLSRSGATNDIIAAKFSFTGEGGATYTLTDSADVEVTSGTTFTLMLSATDKAAVNQIVNKDGTASTSGTSYNLAAAEDWAAGADADVNITDTIGNGITVSNVPAPTITSATYDASTGTLAVTGNGFLSLAGATNDIVASKFTFTGEGGATYTLTDSANVEITSGTAFTIMLSATDKAAVNQIVNKNGTSSTSGTTYNLAAAEDWAVGADAAVTVADTTGNSVTVSNVAVPTITAASYDANSGALTVTGTDFLSRSGATNDIVATAFTFTGEGGATYTLTDSADVEVTSGTAFTLMLSATDKAAVDALLNRNGTSAYDATTYNLAAADNWAAGADAIVNVTDWMGNSITVSNAATPSITSATYNASTGIVIVTGANIQANSSGADIDVSKLTFTGEGGATYTLTDSADVERDSATQFSVTLSATDQAAVNLILNKNGAVSTDVSTYNLAAADDWNTHVTDGDTADTTGNGVTVSNVAVPTITSATYDANSGALTVTGTDFLSRSGATNDIVATAFTFTGEGGATYTLTDSADVEVTSGTAFTLMLSATDKAAVNQITNRNGTSSTSGTTYNLAAAEDWAAGANADVNITDTTGNGITVSNVPAPTITSATYDASTGTLAVTGNGFLSLAGATNDIVASKFTFTGEGGATYTLTDSANVEITSGTAFTIMLSATDKAAVNQIVNKDGTASTSGTTYNLAAAEDWAAGADAAVTVADTTGNSVTVSNVAVPTITAATYDANSGALTVTGTDFLRRSGDHNDVVASKFTFTGEGGATYTLTDSADVEVTSGTAFTLVLSATDKAAVDALLNRNGTSAYDATTYNLAAADDWAAGADAIVNVTDLTGNSITVSNAATPSITSATYDASTGALVVTGANIQANSSGADIDVSKLTFTGEGGTTYTLTDSVDVERDSATQFSVTLSATDQAAINLILNKDGAVSTDVSTYNLAAADDWNTHVTDGDTADDAGNGITVSNVAVPTITSATYDANSGALTVTGTGFLSRSGATNDIIATNFSFTGEGGATYTLTDSADVEITSGTAFTLMLSATDKAAVDALLNRNGTSAYDATTYNLAAADDWAAGADAAVNVADLISNSITVSNAASPSITSATYDASTGALVVTGANIQANSSGADIDVSKLTFTGEGGATYTLTDSADVERDSATQFSVTLSATDQAAVNLILNKDGAVSTDVSTYNLAAADDWNTHVTDGDTADNTGNGITVSNVAVPTITAASYDANSGALTVTGTGFLSRSGATNDIVASKFTFTGEGGETYTLTDSADVEITSGTAFTIMLSATDKAAINQIVNKNGTSSTSGTTYNLAAAEDWAAGADAAVVVADTTGNSVTVSNVAVPTITAASYDANSGALTVTGTGFLSRSGATNDIVASKFTFTGEGGETYTLTDSANVEITSGTAFAITLSATDKAAVNQIVNKNGTASTSSTTYNLAAAEDWAAGADAAVTVADTTGNGITVSNVPTPTITSAAYDYATGVLVVTGENFVKANGAANDIDVSKFTFTGQGGATYTLTDSTDVEITSDTSFTVTLSATDKAAVNLLLNKNGTASSDNITYNLEALDDVIGQWAVGVDTGINVADTMNGITVSNVPAPSSGSETPPPVNTPVDGIDVSTISQPDGSVLITAPIVTGTRQDDPTSLHTDYADIPILNDTQGDALLTVSLPVGVGLRASGQPQAQSGEQAINELMQRIAQKTTEGSEERQAISNNGQSFLDALPPGEAINVQTIELTTGGNPTPDVPILITGSDAPTQNKQVLVIDARDLPAGTILQLDNVAFAVIIGAVRTVGGKGQNFVTASGQDQIIILGEDDDILFGGDGSDTVGSLGGSDQVSGDAGDDIVYGGTANDILSGGSGNDQLNGGLGYDIALQEGQLSDYRIDIHGHEVVLTHTNGETDTLTDIEQIRFTSGPSLAIAHSEVEAAAHHLAKNWLNRDLTVTEGQAVQDWHGATLDDIIVAFHALPEASGLSDQTSNTLLAGLGENPHILRLDVEREFIGSVDDDQGYLPLGLALHADGDTGHDVLQMQGSRTDVHLEFNGNALELTRLSDGAMLSLQNAEAIAFDSGDTVILAHNITEGILGRLFHTFLGRDATSAEWQLGREALASEVDPDIILDWFQQRAGLDALSNSDYIQTIFSQSFGRQATEAELNAQLLRLENNQISREWLAVEVAQTTEAEIHLVGSVMLQEGWV